MVGAEGPGLSEAALATADLRSGSDLAAIRASEVRHLSAAWHYIRAEEA